MASKKTGASSPPSRLQAGTTVHSPNQNVNYYRNGRNRAVNAYGYTAARYQGQTVLAGPRGNSLALKGPEGTYHRYILAEFIACLAMIAGGMILVPAQDTAQGAGTAARSFAKQLVQLTALCAVFFMLALAGSGPKTGKVAAAFGGLVTLGVAWNLSGMWSALASALSPAKPKQAAQGAG